MAPLPIVARVGGLDDTVIDANEMALAAGVATGFQFAPVTELMLVAAIARAGAVWRDKPLWAAPAAERHGGRCRLGPPGRAIRGALSRSRARLATQGLAARMAVVRCVPASFAV